MMPILFIIGQRMYRIMLDFANRW